MLKEMTEELEKIKDDIMESAETALREVQQPAGEQQLMGKQPQVEPAASLPGEEEGHVPQVSLPHYHPSGSNSSAPKPLTAAVSPLFCASPARRFPTAGAEGDAHCSNPFTWPYPQTLRLCLTPPYAVQLSDEEDRALRDLIQREINTYRSRVSSNPEVLSWQPVTPPEGAPSLMLVCVPGIRGSAQGALQGSHVLRRRSW